MKKYLFLSIIVFLFSACGSTTSDTNTVPTAEIGSTALAETATVQAPDAGSEVATPVVPAEATTTTAATAISVDPASPMGVVGEFLSAYQRDSGNDAAAGYFDDGLTQLYNGGTTVRNIVGVDPSFVQVNIINEAPYNDNQNSQITAQLIYPNGSETVVVTVEKSNDGWKVAAIAPNPQK
jgi:hypothetical protein